MDDEFVNIALLAGGAYLLLTFGRSITDNLGLTTPVAVTNQQTNPNSPWSPAYYNSIDEGNIFTQAAADSLALQIYNGLHYLWFNDFSSIKGAFDQMVSKLEVSQVAISFAKQFDGSDMLDELTRFLSADQLTELVNYVNNLPAST